jgi:hypothetical protein
MATRCSHLAMWEHRLARRRTLEERRERKGKGKQKRSR